MSDDPYKEGMTMAEWLTAVMEQTEKDRGTPEYKQAMSEATIIMKPLIDLDDAIEDGLKHKPLSGPDWYWYNKLTPLLPKEGEGKQIELYKRGQALLHDLSNGVPPEKVHKEYSYVEFVQGMSIQEMRDRITASKESNETD